MNYINEEEIRKAIQILKPDNELFEVRIIGKYTDSGYFKDADTLITALSRMNLCNSNVYFTLHKVKDACFSRIQHERFMQVKPTTSDEDITAYSFLFVDLDANRVSGVSSSKEEYVKAWEKSEDVKEYLDDLGFKQPIRALSGNGTHLLYKIELENTKENRSLVENCLKALDFMFSDGYVKIDVKTANIGRICKLYGTLAQKGYSTKERPYRMSMIKEVPEIIEITDADVLEKLASKRPNEPPNNNHNKKYVSSNIDIDFDLREWMNKFGVIYTKEERWKDDCTKYVLDHCPFDSSHTGKDACLFQYDTGSIFFKCMHDSCEGKTWQDFRVLYEPDAYCKKGVNEDRNTRQEYRVDGLPQDW